MFQLTEGYDLNQNSREGASLESPPYYHPALRLCSRALGETEVVFSTRGAYFNWQETPSTRKKEEAKKAMAGNNSISGAWVLDLNRSDTMEGYLRCMRIPEPAIQHQILQEQGSESRNVIALDNHALVIVKRTWVRTFSETLVLGEERVVEGGTGPRRSTATLVESDVLDAYVITSFLTASGGHMAVVEARQLIDNGMSHIQEINITNLTTGMQHVTRRIWFRVPMTNDDQAGLSAEQAS